MLTIDTATAGGPGPRVRRASQSEPTRKENPVKLSQIKTFGLAALLAAPASLCMPGDAHATPPGDTPAGAVQHYFGAATQTGQSRVLAYVGANVSNFTQLESDIAAMLPAGAPACTRANTCIKVVGATGLANSGIPTSDTAADRHDAATFITALHLANTAAQIVFIDCDGKNATNFLNAGKVPKNTAATLNIKGIAFGWGISLTDANQTSLSSWYGTNPTTVVAPEGLVAWSGRIRVGFTTYIPGSADTAWSGFTGASDVMALGDSVTTKQEGSDVTETSFTLAPALVLGLANAESGSIATLTDFLNADPSFYHMPTGVTNSALGALVKYGQL